jgi:signal transduction histidine kinase/CHASE3 domain sensor protein
MLRNMKVGTKLVTVLAAPVLVLVILAVVGVTGRLAEADDANRVEQLTEFVAVNAELINQLQQESVWSASFMASGGSRYRDELQTQRQATDAALDRFRSALERIQPGRDNPQIQDAIERANNRLTNLRINRNSVDNRQTVPSGAVEQLANTTGDLISINARIVQEASDAKLLLGLSTVTNFEEVKNDRAEGAALLSSVAVSGAFTNKEGTACSSVDADDCVSYQRVLSASNDEAQASESFDQYASGPAKTTKRDVEAGLRFDDIKQDILEQGADSNVITVPPDQVIKASLEAIDAFYGVEQGFIRDVVATANDLAASAESAARLYLVGAVSAIAFALVVAFLVARATTVPLRKLTSAAYTLSTDKLPGLVERLRNPDEADEPLSASLTPIDINSKDEIGQLADAFNSIQQVTVEVAEEQAQLLRKGIGDIFINLARRNQSLLDRQIEFIDQLEANEEDPDQLDNLFKLDHLATRMRRNAESLLVLAGAEPPRRRGRPVALADVVRVAIGEVEDFARIQLLALDEAMVGGNVAVDLAHLLSELMENATHFSPPDTMVEIVGHRAGAEGYIISVSDQGIGMSADQLAEANRQLAKPPLVGLAMSRSLGFIVIGRLAQRFGISVKLTASPSGGVTALVTLPPDLVTYPGEESEEPTGTVAEPGETATALEAAPADEARTAVEGAPAADEVVEVSEAEPEAPETEAEPVVVRSEDLLDELVEQVVPEGDEFDRGLQSLVEEQLAPGPVEPPAPGAQYAAPAEPEGGSGAHGSVATVEAEEQVATAAAPSVVEEPPAPAPAETQTPPAETLTAAGLVRRTPKKRAADAVGAAATASTPLRSTGQTQRSPEEVRKMLSRYRSGLNKGRASADSERQNKD